MPSDGGIRTLLLIGRARKAKLVDIRECTELPGWKAFLGDGVVELTVGGVAIFDETIHVAVEGLWNDLAEVVAQYRAQGHAETRLWEGYGALRLEPIPGGRARFTLAFDDGTSRRGVTGEQELLAALTAGGVAFFEKLGELTGGFHDRAIAKLTGRNGAGRTGPSA
ncbi:hypothetical protein M8542_00585 [Amycolatopsis sp. OK19-0408]|uniref:Uncharacterized protein n=1 Tax=Amycolatopsis iheyensis TaxID=2945988 RepID=A0A9X2N3K7_9PSEU|nr:hypothetical protein [Amycolatopsis iheyensis]MCR6481304.1 hypothetical protein [Amycolatopsis iheyensis]